MALFQCNIFSSALGMPTGVNVILPQNAERQIGMNGGGEAEGCPVLYLLHGLSDDCTTWLRRTSVERYSVKYNLALIMPEVHRSFYSDMESGLKYWEYISEELPALMQSFFRFSTRRKDTFVAGLSMGGYGAMKLAFNHPERFAAAAGLSGAFSPEHLAQLCSSAKLDREFQAIYGKDYCHFRRSCNDLYFMAEKCAKEKTLLPELFLTTGLEDGLHSESVEFRDHLQSLDIKVTYDEQTGNHSWDFWDLKIQQVLEWLPLRKRG